MKRGLFVHLSKVGFVIKPLNEQNYKSIASEMFFLVRCSVLASGINLIAQSAGFLWLKGCLLISINLRCFSAQDRSSGLVKSLTFSHLLKKEKGKKFNTEKRELINILAAGREQHKLTR